MRATPTVTSTSSDTLEPIHPSVTDSSALPAPEKLRVPPEASVQLDLLRAAAAGLVLLGHLRGLFFVSYGHVAGSLGHNPVVRLIYAYTSLGHQAVMVFFVLSGFFISASALRSILSRRWSWSWYLTQRLTRLWIVLVPALLLCAMWDQAGIHLLHAPAVYHGLPADRTIIVNVFSRTSPAILVANMAFLQNIWAPTFGSDGPLWSLSYEFWYYILFPCLALLLIVPSRRVRAAAVVALLSISVFVGRSVLLAFPIWLLGALILLAPRSVPFVTRFRKLALALSWLVLAAALLIAKSLHNEYTSDYAMGLCSALVVYVLASGSEQTRKATTRSRAGLPAHLAGFSYTLYLVHLPLLVFIHAWLVTHGSPKWQPDPRHLGIGFGIALLATAYAYAVSRVTEARTEQARALVNRARRALALTPQLPA